MRAVRFHGVGNLTVEDVPPPASLAAGELRLKVLAAGICGSDLHNFRTGQWISRLPVTPGHEFAAEVIEVGADVTGFKPGDRVVADSRAPCRNCAACLSGRANLCLNLGYVGEVCDGGFAEQVVLSAAQVLPVDPNLRPEVAALAEPLAVALHALWRLDPSPKEPVLVAGGGPIGGLVGLLLNHFGFGPVLLAEKQPRRRDLLLSVAPMKPVELTPDSIAAAADGRPIRFAIEATGVGPVLDSLLSLVQGGARIAMVGIFHGSATINATAIVEREIELRGCSVFAGEQKEAIALLPALASRLASLVSAPIGLDEVPAAYRDLIEGRAPALKTIIRPNGL